jgi:hypothetical protein
MSEREVPPLKTPEEIGQDIVGYAEKAEFGTPEFQALSDYFDKENLLNTYNMQIRMAEHPDAHEVSEIKIESIMRVSEMQIALLEHQINQKKSVVPGYDRAMQYIEWGFDQLGVDSIINPEAEKDGDETELYNFPSNNYHKFHTKAEEIVYKKRAEA